MGLLLQRRLYSGGSCGWHNKKSYCSVVEDIRVTVERACGAYRVRTSAVAVRKLLVASRGYCWVLRAGLQNGFPIFPGDDVRPSLLSSTIN